MNQYATRPCSRNLIINENIWFGKKSRKAPGNAEFFRTESGILPTTGTPTIKNRSLSVKLSNVLDDGRYRDALAAHAANQRVIYVHEHMNWRRRCGWDHRMCEYCQNRFGKLSGHNIVMI
jgi:hypothetical protein